MPLKTPWRHPQVDRPALPALQRGDQSLRLGRIPLGAALDRGELAAVLVDDQGHRQPEGLAVLVQGLEGIPARIRVARERLDADAIQKRVPLFEPRGFEMMATPAMAGSGRIPAEPVARCG
jgi:hypothetical protein